MLFIQQMWDSENQRQGMKSCTPVGYTVRGIGELMGFFGLIFLFIISGYLVLRFFRHQLISYGFWLLLVPLIAGIVGRVLCSIGWRFAIKRQFSYDYDTRTARWLEDGQEKIFPNAP